MLGTFEASVATTNAHTYQTTFFNILSKCLFSASLRTCAKQHSDPKSGVTEVSFRVIVLKKKTLIKDDQNLQIISVGM